MTDDLTWHVDQPCRSPVSVSHVPLAKMSISKHTHGVGGIWHEKGSPYRPRPLRVCVAGVGSRIAQHPWECTGVFRKGTPCFSRSILPPSLDYWCRK